MLNNYRGVKVEQQHGLLAHICNGHYDLRRGVILLRNDLPPDKEEAILEHEFEHYEFGQRHRWLGRFALNDNLFIVSFAAALIFRFAGYSFWAYFMLLALPFLIHELRTEARTTRTKAAIIIYSTLAASIVWSVFL